MSATKTACTTKFATKRKDVAGTQKDYVAWLKDVLLKHKVHAEVGITSLDGLVADIGTGPADCKVFQDMRKKVKAKKGACQTRIGG